MRVTRKVLQSAIDDLESTTGKNLVLDHNSKNYYAIYTSNDDHTTLDHRFDDTGIFAPYRKPRELLAWIKAYQTALESC